MGLFEKFNDTIFLKQDSNLEKEIEELKKIKEMVQDKDRLDIDIKKCELGLYGEKQIEYELKTSNIGMYVLHDIRLEYDDLDAQIDYIVVTPSRIFIVECKNLIGNVTVDKNGQFIREYMINGRKIKESIYSPYNQVMRHIDIIKKRWLRKHDKWLDKLIYERNLDNWYKPIVVFSNPKGILNISKAPKEIREHIVKIDQLKDYLKKDYNNTEKYLLSKQKDMLETAQSFLDNNVPIIKNRISKYDKIEPGTKSSISNSLELELREYRKRKSKENNIPAYYVFNDKELERLLLEKPKSFEELESKKILSDIKLKCHGEEIIKIINNL